jgi:uncharacterized membrane-anchored protein
MRDRSDARAAFAKVPEVTLLFWVMKILATTLGETGGDSVTMSMNLGYVTGSAIFEGLFVAVIAAQIHARKFHPALFWAVIVATTTLGTTVADFLDRSLGIGYTGGASILLLLLIATLVFWHLALGSVAINDIHSRKAEIFYWVTILFSQTLGTALGDWMADTSGLGYLGAAAVFGAALVIVALAWFYTRISHALLFWAAFVLTRPLGATLGDFLDKPHSHGGMALSRYAASAVIAAVLVACVFVFPQRPERLRQPA